MRGQGHSAPVAFRVSGHYCLAGTQTHCRAKAWRFLTVGPHFPVLLGGVFPAWGLWLRGTREGKGGSSPTCLRSLLGSCGVSAAVLSTRKPIVLHFGVGEDASSEEITSTLPGAVSRAQAARHWWYPAHWVLTKWAEVEMVPSAGYGGW